MVAGVPLVSVRYPSVERGGLLEPDLLRDADLPTVSPARRRTAAAVVSLGWLLGAVGISVGVPAAETAGSTLQVAVGAVAVTPLPVATACTDERLSDLPETGADRARTRPADQRR